MGKPSYHFITLILCILLLMAGCSPDSREIDNRSMIVGMAIDKAEEEGFYSVSIQIPKFGGGDASPQSKKYEVFSAKGERLWDAIVELESHTPNVLFFGHLKVVAVSDKVAKEGLRPIIDYLDRNPVIANLMQILIIKDQNAKEFISQESPLVTLPALYLDNFFTTDQKLARSYAVKLFEYRRDSNSVAKTALLPFASNKEKVIIVKDMGIFKEHKLVGELKGPEVGVATLLRKGAVDELNKSITVKLEDGTEIKVAFKKITLTRKLSYQKTQPLELEIKIVGKGKVAELGAGKTKANFIKQVEKQISEVIKKDIQETLTKLQKLNVEPFLFSQRIWALNPQYLESLDWEKEGWKETKIKISVDFKIGNTGQRGIFQ